MLGYIALLLLFVSLAQSNIVKLRLYGITSSLIYLFVFMDNTILALTNITIIVFHAYKLHFEGVTIRQGIKIILF